MKKLLFLGVLLSLAALAFGAPSQVSIGITGFYAPVQNESQSVLNAGSKDTLDYDYSALGARAFLDFGLVSASVGYRTAVSKVTVKETYLGASLSSDFDFSLSLVDVRLIGKYPLELGGFTVFPLIGVSYSICLDGKINNVDFTSQDKEDYSDWFLIAGLGADFKVGQQLLVRAEVTGGYNLSAKRSDSYYAGFPYDSSSGWEILAAFGIGYSL